MFFIITKRKIRKWVEKKEVNKLIDALKHENLEIRKSVAEALGEVKDISAIEPLIDALKDEVPAVQMAAAEALGEIRDPSAVEPLLINAWVGFDMIRDKAAEALRKIGPEAVGPLVSALKNKDAEIRKKAAEALGEVKDISAVEPLIDSLKENDFIVQRKILNALGKIKDPRAVDFFIDALKDVNLRREATEALEKFGGTSVLLERLIPALKDELSNSAASIFESLPANEQKAITLLLFNMETDNRLTQMSDEAINLCYEAAIIEKSRVSESATDLLCWTKDSRVGEVLEKLLLPGQNNTIRKAIFSKITPSYVNAEIPPALDLIGWEKLAIKYLNDPEIGAVAGLYLARHPSNNAVQAIIDLIKNSESFVHPQIVTMLGNTIRGRDDYKGKGPLANDIYSCLKILASRGDDEARACLELTEGKQH